MEMPRPAKAARRCARVRMYNVGFGDCFLLMLPTDDGEKRVLIDCGSLKAGEVALPKIVKQVIADLSPRDKAPALDLLIATHRHRDHISGFSDAGWQRVSVGEVWMPWTENPADAEARTLTNAQTTYIRAVDKAIGARPALLASSPILKDMLLNAQPNSAALATLHSGFKNRPKRRYLPGAKGIDVITDVLPGVTIHVLGPSRDKAVRRWMEPTNESDAYLAALEGETAGDKGDEVTFEFGINWAIRDDYIDKIKAGTFPKSLRLNRRDVLQLRHHAEQRDWELLAAKADQALNNTSLILMFEVGSAYLLFPGDAQWGPWQRLLNDPDTRELLSRTTFYKVSHHGSSNATPKRLVEAIKAVRKAPKRISMVSVAPYKWAEIPRRPLLDALKKISADVIRSDKPSTQAEIATKKDGYWVEVEIPVG